jgi:hypothetical protein
MVPGDESATPHLVDRRRGQIGGLCGGESGPDHGCLPVQNLRHEIDVRSMPYRAYTMIVFSPVRSLSL